MRIWHIWQEHPSETVTRLMDEGEKALAQADLTAAMERYTEVTLKDPNYAEGWNKRALVHYLMKQYQASLSDIRKTLILEPRHFGALSGRGLIYAEQKRWKLAEKAFKEALEIHPNMRGPRTNLHIIEQLRPEEEI